MMFDINLKPCLDTSYHNKKLKPLTCYRFYKTYQRTTGIKQTAIMFHETARTSICSHMSAKSLELKQTIKLIYELDAEIDETESGIKSIMDEINSPSLTIPGISYHMKTMIIAEIDDFIRFDSSK